MKLKIFSIIFFTELLFMVSCKKFVEVGPPSNQIASGTVFLTEETAIAAMNGLYNALSNTSLSFAAGGSTVYLGLYSDELYTTSTTAATVEFANSKLSITNSFVYNNFWRYLYQIIYQSNSCIAGLSNSQLAPELRQQLLGEAYFIRAYCYWHLVNLFGDVPLVLISNDYASVSQMSRELASNVNIQILDDLNNAKIFLKAAYPSTGRYRANHYTAMALLSRIHIYLGNWKEALDASNEVIGQSMYTLETDLNRVFLIDSKEAIWQTATGNSSQNTYEGFAFVPSAGATLRPNYPLTPNLYSAFSTADKRRANWIAIKTVSGTVYQYPYKYKIKSSTIKTEAQTMFRLGEIYLNRAEAKGKLGDNTAIDDLNLIRNRAGLNSLSGLSGQPLVNEILKERRLELFAEWGLRWYDLKRTGKLDQVIGSLKTDWKNSAALFPIPNGEIIAAPNLTQNPGYN